MKHLLPVFFILLLTACKSSDVVSAVSFADAKGYFFKNNQPNPVNPVVIQSQEQLEKQFGYATTMDSRPTSVDFSKQAVIAIVLPETDRATEVKIKSIVPDANARLFVKYHVSVGKQQGYTIQPMAMVVVDKSSLKSNVVAVAE